MWAPAECAGITQFNDAITSGKAPEGADKAKFESFLKMSDQEKTDEINSISSWAKFCKNPTRDNLVSMFNFMKDQQGRTCKISTWGEYAMEFQSSSGIWINSTPRTSDNCGAVDVSSFQRATDANQFWTYKVRTVVSNKDEKSWLGKSCKDLETDETYDWKSQSVFLKCDYIKFDY
jgi:hypothetical protein